MMRKYLHFFKEYPHIRLIVVKSICFTHFSTNEISSSDLKFVTVLVSFLHNLELQQSIFQHKSTLGRMEEQRQSMYHRIQEIPS